MEVTPNISDWEEMLHIHLARPESFKNNLDTENEDFKNLPERLGNFLIDTGFIQGMEYTNRWHDEYNSRSKKIFMWLHNMPENARQRFIVMLWDSFPLDWDETKRYTILHETSHAYQEYLYHKELSENNVWINNWSAANIWAQEVLKGTMDSTYAILWKEMYDIRMRDLWRTHGLSTFGSVENYTIPDNEEESDRKEEKERKKRENKRSQAAIRAIEDANELVNMYLWDPTYLQNFLRYISWQLHFSDEQIYNEWFVKITKEYANILLELIWNYVEEMMKTISKHEDSKERGLRTRKVFNHTLIQTL